VADQTSDGNPTCGKCGNEIVASRPYQLTKWQGAVQPYRATA
jgi:hypothetical protein